MDFIVDNYFWFIVGGIVVLMIIIGFIAEKTDFGRKPFSTKKVNNEENNTSNEELEENTEEPVVIPETTDDSNEFVMEDGLVVGELPESLVEEGNVDAFEQIEEQNNAQLEEPIEAVEDAVEETMTDLDIPEIANDDKEVAPEVSDIAEEVITDDSEDDVWKF